MLGKKRSPYGEFIDKHLGYGGQELVRDKTKLSRDVIRKACSDPEAILRPSTKVSLISAARELTGKQVGKADFGW
ncbi:hypothetical protein [Gorillibacterium sp. sgz5001074]|uniref:hypothetical protein n=1 Tax=Gorillibacterium sp. sgz5001074 TaxID=3446695 RepID=UPI003F67FC03